MTYKESYNKIIEAYFKDEIQPFDSKFCFCGTLAYDDLKSFKGKFPFWRKDVYSSRELNKMEKALLITIRNETIGNVCDRYARKRKKDKDNHSLDNHSLYEITTHPNYEDALFNGMSKALDVLREIHKERGEKVDEEMVFTQRQLEVA